MLFEKGNKAASKQTKKEVAEIIRKRLVKDGDSLSVPQFNSLVGRFNALVVKRRRRRRDKSQDLYLGKKKSSFRAFGLIGEEAVEAHRIVLQLEAERAAIEAKGRNGNTA